MLLWSIFVVMLSLSMDKQTPIVVPVEKEPRHHVILENPYVRVLDVVIPAGDTTLYHTHSRDSVFVQISPSSTQSDEFGKASGRAADHRPGEVRFAAYATQPFTHRVTNTGSSTAHILDVEILSAPSAKPKGPDLLETKHYKLIFENERVRVYERTLAAGESTGIHTHWRPHLGIAITECTLMTEMPSLSAERSERAAGSVRWRDVPFTHSTRNVGTAPAITLDIEPK